MEIQVVQVILLALIQGAAELLPVSSSAHVIVAEKLMGIDPSTPAMTFLLVMLHTGTMFSVLLYFWPRWKKLSFHFLKMTMVATAATGVVGLCLKKGIEVFILERFYGQSQGEIEYLFKSLPLIAVSLGLVGLLILGSAFFAPPPFKSVKPVESSFTFLSSTIIGVVQGLCLPFRGFSRSGATISTGILIGISKERAEDFSFALAVILTPPVLLREWLRVRKTWSSGFGGELLHSLTPGFLGMFFSFIAGWLALKWLSSWLEKGRWKFFGFYCLFASVGVITIQVLGF